MNITLKNAADLINSDYKHVLEFGVYHGKTMRQLREHFDESFSLFGFDSFQGLPEDWSGTSCKKGSLSTNGYIPTIPGVKIYPGWFADTLIEYLTIAEPIALLHIDSDLYSSAVEILWSLREYILPGTVIVFDEWVYNHNDVDVNRQHEQRAFYEWVAEFDIEYELIPRLSDHANMERQIVIIK